MKIKNKNKLNIMKTRKFLVTVLSILMLSILGGCDLFNSDDDECAKSDIHQTFWFNVNSNSFSYFINVTDKNVSFVEMDVTYFINRCGSPHQRAYYTLPKKMFNVRTPERLAGIISGYSCSTQLRNFNDEIIVIVELKFSNLLEQVGSRTIRLTKNGAQLTKNGDDVTWNPNLSTSF